MSCCSKLNASGSCCWRGLRPPPAWRTLPSSRRECLAFNSRIPLMTVGLDKPLELAHALYAAMAEQHGFPTHKPPFLGFIQRTEQFDQGAICSSGRHRILTSRITEEK